MMGLLSSIPEEFGIAKKMLSERFGKVIDELGPMPFNSTPYYDLELGTPILRSFLAFEEPVSPAGLPDAKLFTNSLEDTRTSALGRSGRRSVNIDPGLLDATHLVLASTKGGGHRVYAGKGIFGEVTLIFMRGKWDPLPWTYPDYASDGYHAFFSRLRDYYIGKMRKMKNQPENGS